MLFNDRVYNILRGVTTIILPAIGTLYFALAQLWNLPYAEQVTGTITILVTFLGVLLNWSRSTYQASDIKYDGNMVVLNPPGGPKTYSLEVSSNIDDLDKKKEILLKVTPS